MKLKLKDNFYCAHLKGMYVAGTFFTSTGKKDKDSDPIVQLEAETIIWKEGKKYKAKENTQTAIPAALLERV